MYALKYAKIDWMKTKSQSRLMLLFLAIAVFIGMKMDTPFWGMFYMAFGATVISSTPFALDAAVSGGFVKMLPSKPRSRSYGRFLFGMLYGIAAVLLGDISVLVLYIVNGKLPEYTIEANLVIMGLALIFTAFQYLVQSFISVKSQQAQAFIRMIPPFVMFFGGNYIMGALGDGEGISSGVLEFIDYCMSHSLMMSAVFFAASVLVMVLSAIVAGMHEK